MTKENTSGCGGIGFTSLLQIAFLVLKLTKAITWSWWWVLAPTWIPAAIVLVVAVSCAIPFLFDKD